MDSTHLVVMIYQCEDTCTQVHTHLWISIRRTYKHLLPLPSNQTQLIAAEGIQQYRGMTKALVIPAQQLTHKITNQQSQQSGLIPRRYICSINLQLSGRIDIFCVVVVELYSSHGPYILVQNHESFLSPKHRYLHVETARVGESERLQHLLSKHNTSSVGIHTLLIPTYIARGWN